ncbi:MAG: hypothetical protein AB7P01_14620 [Bacteroidia bacterium]
MDYDIYSWMQYDSKLLNQYHLSFFEDDASREGESVGVLDEKKIVEFFFGDAGIRHLLYKELGLHTVPEHFLEISKPIAQYPGDIDVMLINNANAHQTIAIECKVVKVTFERDGREKVNKIEKLAKGVGQANGLREMGFYKSYLMVFIVSDARFDLDNSHIWRRVSSEKLRLIVRFTGYEDLHKNVGLIICMISQPTGNNIRMTGSVAVKHKIPAEEQEQGTKLTAKIKEYLQSQGR